MSGSLENGISDLRINEKSSDPSSRKGGKIFAQFIVQRADARRLGIHGKAPGLGVMKGERKLQRMVNEVATRSGSCLIVEIATVSHP